MSAQIMQYQWTENAKNTYKGRQLMQFRLTVNAKSVQLVQKLLRGYYGAN